MNRSGSWRVALIVVVIAVIAVMVGLGYVLRQLQVAQSPPQPPAAMVPSSSGCSLRVLSYTAFLGTWGPGPELAKRFATLTGCQLEFLDAGDAGLLLQKLTLFPSDVVIGFDQLSVPRARLEHKWRPLGTVLPNGIRWAEPEFMPIDWAPMTFVYRTGEIQPPTSLNDLLHPRFQGAITLQDPRTSTPGQQFLFWVLDELGVEQGFAFLARLKPSLLSVASNWTESYGLFTKKLAKLTFSYMTSPAYHWVEEKDRSYQPIMFKSGQPVQIEYAAISDACANCAMAERLLVFMHEPETQKLIMEKNYMFPVDPNVANGTPFAELLKQTVSLRTWLHLDELLKRRDELFETWRELKL